MRDLLVNGWHAPMRVIVLGAMAAWPVSSLALELSFTCDLFARGSWPAMGIGGSVQGVATFALAGLIRRETLG